MTVPVPGPSSLRRTWCEVDRGALAHNITTLRALAPQSLLAPVVKSNAYGHGAVLAAKTFVQSGAQWLCVDALHEAADLRQAGLDVPVLTLGHIPVWQADAVVALGVRCVVYERTLVEAIATRAREAGVEVGLHIKLETGTHRQGLGVDEALGLAQVIVGSEGVRFEGVTSHFANVEDTTDHTFARGQLERFDQACQALMAAGLRPAMRSIANSAATILWEHSQFELTRPGLACYGMWPSPETYVSAMVAGRDVRLRPALTWKTSVAQLKDVPVGAAIGYGCSFKTTHPTRIAVLPVGYYDGYDRGLSNLAHVLVRGHRAPLRGRVCMNMIMVDVTDVPSIAVGDEVVLLGEQGQEAVTAEMLASWAGTINYEITTRIHESIPRIPRPSSSTSHA